MGVSHIIIENYMNKARKIFFKLVSLNEVNIATDAHHVPVTQLIRLALNDTEVFKQIMNDENLEPRMHIAVHMYMLFRQMLNDFIREGIKKHANNTTMKQILTDLSRHEGQYWIAVYSFQYYAFHMKPSVINGSDIEGITRLRGDADFHALLSRYPNLTDDFTSLIKDVYTANEMAYAAVGKIDMLRQR